MKSIRALHLARSNIISPCATVQHTRIPRASACLALRYYSSQNLLQQAHRALNEKNYPKAQSLFQQLTLQSDSTIDSYYNLGVVQWLSKDPKEAVKSWQNALR